ncbi:MAG: lysylphosphatidylglycerol synthase domain-containing protein [Alphaproteobacteria bacterium]|nr:lysylphosphatidylglycerol synthase domain-containing protein [Alphaproteobacteria bacterium]
MKPTLKNFQGAVSAFVSLPLLVLAIIHLKFSDFSKPLSSDVFTAFSFVFAFLGLACVLDVFRIRNLFSSTGIQVRRERPLNGPKSLLWFVAILLFGTAKGHYQTIQSTELNDAIVKQTSACEQRIRILIAGILGLIGLLVIFRHFLGDTINLYIPLWQVTLALCMACGISLWWSRRRVEDYSPKAQFSLSIPNRLLKALTLSTISQILVLLSFSLILRSFNIETKFGDLFAGAAIVCFIAALPMSLNGWGVRELAAVHIFSLLGVPPGEAVMTSIIIGLSITLISFLTLLVFQGSTSETKLEIQDSKRGQGTQIPNIKKSAPLAPFTLLVGLSSCILLFFQFRVTINATTLTLNLADPVALGALVLAGVFTLSGPHPVIRMPKAAWYWIAGLTLMLGLSFLNGVNAFGVTSWALGNRLVGWIVLLGYAASGAMLVTYFGAFGRKRIAETLLATAVSVVLVHTCARIGFEIDIFNAKPPYNFEGFSANRNSFAFQALIVLGMSLVTLKPNRRSLNLLFTISIAIILFGILQSGSLTGIIASGIVLVFLAFHFPIHRQRIFYSMIAAIILWQLGGNLLPWLSSVQRDPQFRAVPEIIIIETSFTARWLSIQAALQAFLNHPIFGAGLGWGIKNIVSDTGENILIHSTYMWILAETGLVGFIAVFWYPCLSLLPKAKTLLSDYFQKHCKQSRQSTPNLWPLITFLCFGLFSVTHEIGYQRILWLVIGAGCALPLRTRK